MHNPLICWVLDASERVLRPFWKLIFRLNFTSEAHVQENLKSSAVAVDVTHEFTSSKFRGIGNYARWFLGIIQIKLPSIKFIAHIGEEIFLLTLADSGKSYTFNIIQSYPNLSTFMNNEKIDTCILLSPFETDIKTIKIPNKQSWIVLYDFIPLYRPWQFQSISMYLRYLRKVFQIRFSKVFTISDATHSNLLELFPKHSNNSVIPINFDLYKFTKTETDVIEKNSFLVFVSRDPRKNTLRVLKAWISSEFAASYKLYLVGELKLPKYLYRRLLSKNNTIIYVQNPSSENLGLLLESCEYLIAPSLNEGLGLPLIEGSHLKKKVIYSTIPSHMELVESGGGAFNPKSIKSLRSVFRGIQEGLEIPELILKDYSKQMEVFLSTF